MKPLLLLFICSLVATGCSLTSPETESPLSPLAPSPSATLSSPAATHVPASTVGATVAVEPAGNTPPATSQPPSSTPTPVPVATPSPAELFALDRVHRETLEAGDGTVRRVSESGYPIIHLEASPDSRWLAATLQLGGNRGTTANAVIDLQGELLWWANKESFYGSDIFGRSFHWLPDSRFLWVDENHHVFVGDNQERRLLAAPVPIYTIVYASENIAFGISDGLTLWRVDMESGQWEEVANPRPPQEGHLGGYFGISRDGAYALAFQSGQMWRIPAVMGAAAEPLPDVQTALTILGSGMPVGPPQQLAGLPYWLIPLPFQTEEGVEMAGIVVDTRDGTVLSAEDLGLPGNLYLLSYRMSPAGEWLAIVVAERETRQPTGLYLVSADDLAAEPLADAEHEVAGWHADPPAVILRNRESGALSLQWLPPGGETEPIPLAGATALIATTPGAIFATDNGDISSVARPWFARPLAGNATEILQFDVRGNPVDSLAFPPQTANVRAAVVASDRLLVAIESCAGEGICTASIVDWLFERE